MIKILLAEGHNVVRNGIKSLLDNEQAIEVIAEVNNGEAVLELLKEGCVVDIIISAINMAEMGGVELTRQIKLLYPAIKVVILSRISDERVIMDAFKAGASGYLLKSIDADEFIFGLNHIYKHTERYVCNEVALALLDKLIKTHINNSKVDVDNTDISHREIEVLALIAQGFTNQEIADKLFTSKRTIESHRQSLIEKTGTKNTAALVRYAVLNRIIG
ncbi:DNA-binding NarL/FixJ family response regulator [Mucilaginibacter sp. UYNi724]